MRKSDLAATIAQKADLTKEEAQRVLDAILDQIVCAMGRRDTINLVGFGNFMPRHRGARAGKNPQTGESITIGACNTVAFKPGKNLREAVTSMAPSPQPDRKTPDCAPAIPRASGHKKRFVTSEQRV